MADIKFEERFKKTDEEKTALKVAKLTWRQEMRKKYKGFVKRGFASVKYEDSEIS